MRLLEGADSVAEGSEEATGADSGELAGIADEDRLAAGVVDEAEDWGEHAGLGHPGLVDDDDRAVGEAVFAARVEEEAVDARAADAGCGCELVGGAAARCCAEDRDAGLAVRVG